MKKCLLTTLAIIAACLTLSAQNVFNISDPIVRLDKSKGYGSAQYPDTSRRGLQKYVSIATTGVTGTWDASSFKAYFININGTMMAFRLKFPRSYTNTDSAAKRYPMMLFLHGAGECGCGANGGIYNNEKQLWLGGLLFNNWVNNNLFDGFLIYPQIVNYAACSGVWGSTTPANLNILISIVDSLVKYVRADNDRLLINGLSGGGYGAWRMAAAFPQRVAKIIPSAAAGSVEARNAFVHIPIWFATGGKDPDPSPASAQYDLSKMQEIGADIRYTQYPDLGHQVWLNHWAEPDYVPYMNDVHKANPLIFFQHGDFCANETINARLGITQGFYAYEWQKDGATIATATNGVNTIVQPTYVTSYTGNEIVVKAFGTYRVRFKRNAAAAWSAFSPKPAVIKTKTTTQTPPITISGTRSNVLPAADGSTTVPLQLPPGFINYEWYRVSDNVRVATTQVYNAPVGTYKARYAEQYGCGTSFSPDFSVIAASGTPKPDAATSVVTTALSQTSARIVWSQTASPASNETGFEVYRATVSGGPYQLVTVTAANASSFDDNTLVANSTYYYEIRAINATGASAATTETSVRTLGDNIAPAAPANLQYRGSNSTSVMLTWTAPADGDIKRYDVYVNGSKTFSTSSTSFTVINLDSLKSYAFTVKAADNAGNISPASNQVTGYTHRQGINYKYYTGAWSVLPNFSALTPAKSGATDSVNINNTAIKTTNTAYGFLWQGFIYIPVAATYTFETVSDDGSRLYVDVPYSSTATPLVNNDGIHGAQSRTGSIALTEGYHAIAITHFQNSNGYDMQLYWSNNMGLARERIGKNFFTFVAAAVDAAPAAPTTPAAAALTFNRIHVSWTDASNNEKAFEVARALTGNGVFSTVGTIAANGNSFTDSGLAAAKTYYYKIRAIGNSNESPYSAQVSATTPAAPATPLTPSELATSGGPSSITLTWTDNAQNETNYKVFRSTDNASFALVATLPANANAYTDAGATTQVQYYYYVEAVNASGASPQSNTASAKAGNNAPAISALSAMYVKTYATATQNFTATDNTGDQVTVSIADKPSFVTLTSTGGTGYQLAVAPTANNIGAVTLSVVATDQFGKSTTAPVVVNVADKNTRSVFINLGSAGKTAPLPWNNWLGVRGANNVIAGLKDETNTATSFSLTTVSAWAGTTDLGHISGGNSGIVPDAVLQSGLSDNNASRQLKVSGLNALKRYNLVFVGSQNEGLPATTDYTVGAQKATMDARYNTTQSANLNGLIPDATGSILVTATRTGASANNYLNAVIIEEYDPLIPLLNPTDLYAQAQDRTTVNVTWSDRATNETGYDLVRATDSLFTQGVVTLALGANTTTYKNTGLTPNTRYWYRVRARTALLYSEYSNQARVVTPGSMVYVNFNTTIANAAFPWNNLAVSPMSVFTYSNLKNQAGASTGMSLHLEKIFNGEFTAGVNTGSNSGVAPDNVLLSDYWLDNTQLSQFRLSGLDHTKRYRIGFIGSSSAAGWFKGNYTATYTVGGKTVYLNSWMNSTKIVYIDGVAPDAGGEVMLNFSTTAEALYGFNAGLIIQEYSDRQEDGSLPPSNLVLADPDTAIAAQSSAVKLMAYPNPFHDILLIEFTTPAAVDRLHLELFDAGGRLVRTQVFERLALGRNTLRLDASKTGTGVYTLTARSGGRLIGAVRVLKGK